MMHTHPAPPLPAASTQSSRVAAFTARSRLATSLAGNPVDLLTITAPEGEEEGGGALPLGQRKVVVLSGEAAGGMGWQGSEI